MATVAPGEITQLLLAWNEGDERALAQLVPLVQTELRHLARRYMRREHAGHTLQTTALVNEAYLRLIDGSRVRWQDRAHFFALSAKLMRQILIDYARSRHYLKRGGGVPPVSLDEALIASPTRSADLLALNDALSALEQLDPRKGQIIELRFFGGLSVEEAAEVLKVSPKTIKREWSKARLWLCRALEQDLTA